MRKLSPVLFFVIALVAATLWCFLPGLNGSFLFDDYVNLPALGEFGRIDNLRSFALYLTSGLGDPIGRPLSMLTFLIDARGWPADPYPFLRTNLICHLCNSVLLFFTLRVLGEAAGLKQTHRDRAAFFGALFWSVHPLFLSTTLYIIQRETILAASFILAGILCWCWGRAKSAQGKSLAGIVFLVCSSVICTGLAALCKANGLILPLLLLVLESTVLPRQPNDKVLSCLRMACVAASIALAVFLAININHYSEYALEFRPWTLSQRLLTEPRVLLDYLDNLFIPRSLAAGIFHDDLMPSSDLFHPISTFFALATVTLCIVAAIVLRRSWPLIAFAALFFFAAHAMEATVVPLELYFDHRNYVPAMFLFWPIAVGLSDTRTIVKRLRYVAALLIAALVMFDTHTGARIWGDPWKLAAFWGEHNVDSPRSQAYAAQFEIGSHHYAAAKKRLKASLQRFPSEVQLAFNLADAECGEGRLSNETKERMLHALKASDNAARLDFSWLTESVERAREGTCNNLDLASTLEFLNAVRQNPKLNTQPGRLQDFDHIEGLIDLASGQAQEAFDAFNRSLDRWPRPEIALNQAALLGAAGYPDLGLAHLRRVDFTLQRATFSLIPSGLHNWMLGRFGFWDNEFKELEKTLTEENQKKQAKRLPQTPKANL